MLCSAGIGQGKGRVGVPPQNINPQILTALAAQQAGLSRNQDLEGQGEALTFQQLSRFFQGFFQILPPQAQQLENLGHCSAAGGRLFQTFYGDYHRSEVPATGSLRSETEPVRVLGLLAFIKSPALLSTVGSCRLQFNIGQEI